MNHKIFRALGMISGTSIDGIDTALIETDGHAYVRPLAFLPHSYQGAFREKLRLYLGRREGRADPEIAEFERELTLLHANLVQQFMQQYLLEPEDVNLIGFHGQTIWHNPEEGETIQLGDGALLAELTGISVVNDFRSADVAAGGHGAPLVPLYHRALAADLPLPVAIINIGGVSNITWIGGSADNQIFAFDMGPGNALIDDWVLLHTGQPYDEAGLLAGSGRPDMSLVDYFIKHPFFAKQPPKSLDRDMFRDLVPQQANVADGAATITMMTVAAIVEGLKYLPLPPLHIYLTGGGRYNQTMMRWLAELSGLPVSSVDALGWSGDGLEAEAFGYLGVRSLLGLPLSVPGTTGVTTPMCGGHYYPIKAK